MTSTDAVPGRHLELADDLVAGLAKATEALEYVERARGHLYDFHHLTGHADALFGEAVDLLRRAGAAPSADVLSEEIVGLNVLDGRWTYQVVDEFDAGYYRAVTAAVRSLEDRYTGGDRHVHEARMKEERRTAGRPGHEATPPSRQGH